MFPFSPKSFGLALIAALALCGTANAQAPGADTYDDKAAVIFAYFAIGNDDNPSASLTREQFLQQIEEITTGGYTVKPLPEIVDAFAAGKSLPDKTIAITFDGADKSIVDVALPVLQQHNLPFTIFVPADKIASEKPPFLTWSELRTLKRNPLVTFGLHPAAYSRLADSSEDEIKRQINSSIAAIRKNLDIDVSLMAYPYGEYDEAYKTIVKGMGFKAAFGQQSGVAYAGDDRFALPRFTLTERYGDLERFQMTASALPLPVKDVSPDDPHLTNVTPAIGFTVDDTLAKSLKKISCFSSSEEKPKLEILNNRVELRLEKPFNEDRPRINCTLPVSTAAGEEPRWRWFGVLYTVPQALLEAAQPKTTAHAADESDSVSLE